MHFTINLIASLIISGCSSAATKPMSFAEAVRIFEAQPKTTATNIYDEAWAEFESLNYLGEKDGCWTGEPAPLILIFEIDANGKVIRYFASKENESSECWRRVLLGRVGPKPPFTPYFHKIGGL